LGLAEHKSIHSITLVPHSCTQRIQTLYRRYLQCQSGIRTGPLRQNTIKYKSHYV